MNSKDNKLSNFILPVYGNLLKWAVVILAGYQLLWGLLQYVIWDLPYIRYEKRACLALILAFVIYLALCAFAAPDRLRQLGRKMKKYCTYEQIFLAGLVVWYAISCLVRKNIDHPLCFKHNDNRLFITWTSAFILFPLAEMLGPKRIRRFWETMIHLMTGIYTPVSVLALVLYYQGKELILLSGKKIVASKSLSLMIGCNRNITGIAAAVMLAMSIYMIINKSNYLRAVYLIAATVHALVVVFSNSRTSFLASVFMVVATIAVVLGNRVNLPLRKNQNRRTFPKKVIAVIIVVMVIIAAIILIQHLLINTVSTTLDNGLEVRDNYTNLSGRLDIWKASLVVMFSDKINFFFGVTPSYLPKKMLETGLVDKRKPHAHNAILQIGASLGVPAMVLYIVFLVLLCIRCAKILRIGSIPIQRKRKFKIWPLALIVVFFIIVGITESMTFGVNLVSLPVFYIVSGWIVAYDTWSKHRMEMENASLKRAQSGNGIRISDHSKN